MSALRPGARIHILGVGGAGMSGLALLLHEMGAIVSGCDARQSEATTRLTSEGITVTIGHDPAHLHDVDAVLWSPAINLSNNELVAAKAANVELLSRSEVLRDLGTSTKVIGVTGTHGKTTATSMLTLISRAARRNDGRLLGAPVIGLGENGHWGHDGLLMEVDESYGTFQYLSPHALAVLNIEADHLDHYGNLETLESAFLQLIERTSGPVVVWGGDEGARRVAQRAQREVAIIGDGDYAVSNIALDRRSSSFSLRTPDGVIEIPLRVPGLHNVANAATVAALSLELGMPSAAVSEGLSQFSGAPRRFQYLGRFRGADVFEDYAHLPGEIAATLEAAKSGGYDTITVVFQPHRFTRTQNVGTAFGPALDLADLVVVTDIYSSGEPPIEGVTGAGVANSVTAEHVFIPNMLEIPDYLSRLDTIGDALFFLGAGDIASISSELNLEETP